MRPKISMYCAKHSSNAEICNDAKYICLKRGKKLCDKNPQCTGVMWNNERKDGKNGVMFCTSDKLTVRKEWETYLKSCDEIDG